MSAAARVTDPVQHAMPPVLTGGPGSSDVLIASLPAWRGVPDAAAMSLTQLKQISDTQIQMAEAATNAAAGTPAGPAALAQENGVKAAASASMSAAIQSAANGADIHVCSDPLPNPPHGPGVVVFGSGSVYINSLPATRKGDELLEALGPANRIMDGERSVSIGD